MNRKIIRLLTIVALMSGAGNILSAQQFYPIHFINMFTDEGAEKNNIAILNEMYLVTAGFNRVNNMLYVHPENKEKVMLSTRKKEKRNEITVTYLTNSNPKIFKERLEDKDSGFEKIDENTYQTKNGTIINKFLIDKDTIVDHKKYYPVKYTLMYDKGTKFNISDERNTFPVTGIYPFQHTTWYFKVSYEASKAHSDENNIDIILGKEETPYKIEFTDDENFKITYRDKKGQSRIWNGKYFNDKSDIDFRYAETPETSKDKNGKILHPVPAFFYDPKELAKAEGTLDYFQFIFLRGYEPTYHTGNGTMKLTSRVYVGSPRRDHKPASTKDPAK